MKTTNILVISSSVVPGNLTFTCHGVRQKRRTRVAGKKGPRAASDATMTHRMVRAKGGGRLKAEKPEDALQYPTLGSDDGPDRAPRVASMET